MKYLKKIVNIANMVGSVNILILSMFIIPTLAVAQSGLIPCSGGSSCDFVALIELIKNVINFMMFKLALPLAAISFAVAGIMMLTAGGSTDKIKQAKDIFWYVFVGIVIALSAWLIVNAITSVLLKPGISGLG